MQTAQMRVFRPNASLNTAKKVGAVFDTGSQRTYLTEEVAKELQLATIRSEKLRIQTFGRVEETDTTCPVVEMAIKTYNCTPLKIEALVVPFNQTHCPASPQEQPASSTHISEDCTWQTTADQTKVCT